MEQPVSPPFGGIADALAWLDAHIDFESNMPRRRALPTLDRMRALTALLGEPQESIPSIHITGTNGKGSTSAMATSLLLAKGLSVGHLHQPQPAPWSPSAWPATASRSTTSASDGRPDRAGLLEALLDERPTRFELLTAAALSWFADRGGRRRWWSRSGLGGTWDCTNVVHGDVAVLTNVSFDHTDVLGPTLEGIAADKAGIIEPGSRVVVGEMAPELLAIVGRARRGGRVRPRYGWPAATSAASRTGWRSGDAWSTLWTPGGRYEDVLVPLHGAHQGVNAAVATRRRRGVLR